MKVGVARQGLLLGDAEAKDIKTNSKQMRRQVDKFDLCKNVSLVPRFISISNHALKDQSLLAI